MILLPLLLSSYAAAAAPLDQKALEAKLAQFAPVELTADLSKLPADERRLACAPVIVIRPRRSAPSTTDTRSARASPTIFAPLSSLIVSSATAGPSSVPRITIERAWRVED